eukprot:987516-Pyramimonas_sp.AAC.1
MYMCWRSHRRIQALPHMLDHVPMALELTVVAPPPAAQVGYYVWDWGLLAAGLQEGHSRREFLEDLREALQAAAP